MRHLFALLLLCFACAGPGPQPTTRPAHTPYNVITLQQLQNTRANSVGQALETLRPFYLRGGRAVQTVWVLGAPYRPSILFETTLHGIREVQWLSESETGLLYGQRAPGPSLVLVYAHER